MDQFSPLTCEDILFDYIEKWVDEWKVLQDGGIEDREGCTEVAETPDVHDGQREACAA